MKTQHVEKAFDDMGARVSVAEVDRSGVQRLFGRITIDILNDRKGERFSIRADKDVGLKVLDVRPKERHLVLASEENGRLTRYLCGHDERHWFVAAVPGSVTTVKQAKTALKPSEVRTAEKHAKKRGGRRYGKKPLRQGEWFFVPAGKSFPEESILKNEPIARMSGGRVNDPHMVSELVRTGGYVVYEMQSVRSHDDRNKALKIIRNRTITEDVQDEVMLAVPGIQWRSWVAEPEVYARGTVRHPDHSTLKLDGWHRVYMNTEPRARGAGSVLFVD